MSPSHPLDWNTASEVPGGKPWISLIGGGLLLQVFGGILIGIGISSGPDQSPGETSHAGDTALALGSISAWVGFVLLLVGLIAVGVYLGTRHLDGRLSDAAGVAARPAADPHAAWSQTGADRSAFKANEGDSPVVAQVRAAHWPKG